MATSPAPKAKVIGRPKLTGDMIANILVIFAILCIPLMYGGTLTSAYQDPVENIGHIQAAVVNQDTPYRAELASGGSQTIDVGSMLTDALTNPNGEEDTGFTWTKMDRAQAERDLKNESIRAILYIPAGLSQDVAQIGTAEAASTVPGRIELVTDDGINYLAGTLARTVATTLEGRVTSEASEIYSEKLLESIGSIRSGMAEAADGATQLAEGSSTLADGLEQLDEGANTAADASGQLDAGAAALADGLGQMASQVPALESGVDQLANGGSQLAAGAGTLNSSISQYTSGVDQVASGAATLKSQTPALQAGLETLHDGASQVADGNGQLAEQFHQISDVVAKFDGVPEAIDELVNSIQGDVTQAHTELCSEEPYESDVLCEILGKVVEVQNDITAEVDKVTGKASEAIAGVETAQDSMNKLAEGSAQVEGGVTQLQASVGVTSDTPASQTVLGAINGIDGGLAQLSGNSAALRAGSDQLAGASRQLADGTGALQSQIPTLAAGVTQLNAGAGTLSEGTGQLNEGLTTLAESTGTASEGSAQIAENTDRLSSALVAGTDQIPNYSPAEAKEIAKTASALVEVDPVREHEVVNSGAGFAPMFISLALWIGGIAIFLVLPALDRRPGPGETWWMAAVRPAATAGGFALIQAILATVVTNWAVELHAVNLGGLIGIAILASFTFVAVNQACIAMLGYRGRFVSIVLLLLQIASMGATFPVETMPAFFGWIHPFLPMSYTQLSIRAMIAGSGASGIVGQTVLMLLLWLVVAVALVLLGAYLRTKNHPLPYDAALLPDNFPDEDKASAAQLAGRKDLKRQIVERERERLYSRGIVAGHRGTLGTVGPRSETVTYPDISQDSPIAILDPEASSTEGESLAEDAEAQPARTLIEDDGVLSPSSPAETDAGEVDKRHSMDQDEPTSDESEETTEPELADEDGAHLPSSAEEPSSAGNESGDTSETPTDSTDNNSERSAEN